MILIQLTGLPSFIFLFNNQLASLFEIFTYFVFLIGISTSILFTADYFNALIPDLGLSHLSSSWFYGDQTLLLNPFQYLLITCTLHHFLSFQFNHRGHSPYFNAFVYHPSYWGSLWSFT